MCARGADKWAFLPCPFSLPFLSQSTSGKAVFLTKPLNKSIAKQNKTKKGLPDVIKHLRMKKFLTYTENEGRGNSQSIVRNQNHPDVKTMQTTKT